MARRSLALLPHVLFVFYCSAVGVYLLLRPWSPIVRLAPGLYRSGFFRGFISGLGLIHLTIGALDLRRLSQDLNDQVPRP